MSAAKEKRLNKPPIQTLGLIAGGGELPSKLLQACEKKNIDTFTVALTGQADEALTRNQKHIWSHIGEAGSIIQKLKEENIQDLVLIGKIKRPGIMDLKPDLKTASFFARIGLKSLGDDGILKALRAELENDGFQLHGIQDFVDDILMPEGVLGAVKPSKANQADIQRGIQVTQTLGQLDIGQACVVQQGLVLGVEAIEGTDELIKRCGPLQRKGTGGVLIKLCKEGQDEKLDLPTVGLQTIQNAIQAGLSGIVIHAEKALIVDLDDMIALADKNKLFILGVNPEVYA